MPEPVAVIVVLALLIAAFAAGRFFERFHAPEAQKARYIAAAKVLVKRAENIKPDAAAAAALAAHAAQTVSDLKDEVLKL